MTAPDPKVSLIERAVSRLRDEQGRKDQGREHPSEPPVSTPVHSIGSAAAAHPIESKAATRDHAVPVSATPPTLAPETLDIDFDALRRKGFIVPGTEPTRTVNEFRTIKRPLLASIVGRGGKPVPRGRRIMITSALPGEGKTFCAINLALSLASERDHSVLLIDADVAKPSIPEQLGLAECAGLMDALIDPSIDPAGIVYPTSVEKLSVLMSGRPHPKATELLASASMSHLVDRLAEGEPDRIMIFDSPPLLPTTEARVLASHMGQIVMVVETGKTHQGAVKDALAALESAEGIVSLLLNKSRAPGKRGVHRYGSYGYGYGEA